MQIMPENNLARTAAGTAASASLYADQAGDLFGLEISRLLQDDPQGSLPAETAEMEEDEEDEDERAESAASSPYNPVLRPVSPFEPQEVRLTPDEADSIVEAMREDGVPANVLNAVKDAGRTAGGATLDMLMNAARKALNGERAELSKADGAQLSSLSGKLAGAQSRELAQLLASASESGSASDARNALAAVLNSLNNASSVSMNKEEMSALLKALGISGDTSKGILAAFDDHRSLTMKGGDFAELLKPAGAELASRVNQLDSALASLQKQAAPVMKEARRREELERMAGMREDQAVSRSRILIRDTATQAAPGREDQIAQDKQTRAAALRDTAQTRADAEAHLEAGRDVRQQQEQTASHRDAMAWGQLRDDERLGRDAGGRERGRNLSAAMTGAENRNASRATASFSTGSPSGISGGMFAAMPQGADFAAQAGKTGSLPSTLPSQTLNQIEQAILSSSRNGVQRLEVKLNPVELGAMTIALATNRQGEVSAVIRPEKEETAALINQQVDQIRAELENQGFKVDKVEVQTQLADQGGQNWQGAQQHNASRDLAERASILEQLRNLSRLGSEPENVLARGMHGVDGNGREAANASARGLHLVA